jgi:hypothetical protein
VVRRTLYEQIVESDHYLHQGEQFKRGDTQLWAEMANISRVHYIPESLATYNQTEESATRSKDITKPVRLQIADAELGLYLCNKYNLPSDTRNVMEERKFNGFLRLAFHTKNAQLADEVRSKKKTFTFKEWLLYYGAKKRTIRYFASFAVAFRRLFIEKISQWR